MWKKKNKTGKGKRKKKKKRVEIEGKMKITANLVLQHVKLICSFNCYLILLRSTPDFRSSGILALGSCEVPHKIWVRSVQPFCRLLNKNGQTNKQSPRQTKNMFRRRYKKMGLNRVKTYLLFKNVFTFIAVLLWLYSENQKTFEWKEDIKATFRLLMLLQSEWVN